MTKANKPNDPPKIQDSFSKEIIDPNFKGQEIIKFIKLEGTNFSLFLSSLLSQIPPIEEWNWTYKVKNNVTITNNTALGRGGGIFCYYANPTFSNITIQSKTEMISGSSVSKRYNVTFLIAHTVIMLPPPFKNVILEGVFFL